MLFETTRFRGGLGDSVGARGMIGPRFHKTGIKQTAQFGDAGVVGGHDHLVKFLALFGPFDDVLKEWFPEKGMERFPGEAGGGPAGRDDPNDACFFVVYIYPP